MMTKIKNDQEIDYMRTSGRMLATVLDKLRAHISAGVTSKDLAGIAAGELKKLGGKPAFLDYYGFPDVLCVSINDEVVHGIPSAGRVLKEGDIVSLDFGVNYQGMITDSAISMIVGKTDNKRLTELLGTTEQALLAGVDAIKGRVRVGDISSAVQKVLDAKKFGIVRDYVGHGVGHELHEEPNIPNFGPAGSGPLLKPGMTIAIEPMATLGSFDVFVGDDGWTVKTKDQSLAAHFEHTVLITENGSEIITQL